MQQQAATGSSAHESRPLDPGALTFAGAVYPITPSNVNEPAVAENEIVTITGKLNPWKGAKVDSWLEVEGEWWKGHTYESCKGLFPEKWAKVLVRRRAEGANKTD